MGSRTGPKWAGKLAQKIGEKTSKILSKNSTN
jgi:hypothetical protein